MNKVFIIFKYVILICIFSVSTNTYSQKVYSGNSSYQSDIFCTVSNGYIYIGNSTYQSDIIAYFDGKYLYKGNSKYSSDIILTYSNGKIYNVPRSRMREYINAGGKVVG